MNKPSSTTIRDPLLTPHAFTADACLEHLATTAQGLDAAAVAERQTRFPPNRLPAAQPRTRLAIFLGQFRNPLIYLLLFAAGLAAALGKQLDSFFIGAVLLVNAVLGAYQEWHAERRTRALDRLVPNRVRVIRDGDLQIIDSGALLPGDIVRLDEGQRVPADLRLLDCTEVKADESLLTGESEPVHKACDAVLSLSTPLAERLNCLFAGTTMITGRALAVVTATGSDTELGRIAGALRFAGGELPLVTRMRQFTRRLSVAAVVVIVLLGWLWWARGTPLTEVLLLATALAVASIPEGLPVAMTVALARAVHRMATRQVIVRRLAAVEGLGACTVIASDKTGTLTRNELTVVRWWHPAFGALAPNDPRARELALHGALASDAHLGPGGTRDGAGGDAVDIAFVALAHDLEITPAFSTTRTVIAPFSAERKYMAVVTESNGRRHVHLKGAPEVVLPLCGAPAEALNAVQKLTADGFRVLALACGVPCDPSSLSGFAGRGETSAARGQMFSGSPAPSTATGQDAEEIGAGQTDLHPVPSQVRQAAGHSFRELTFLGLAALIDPPRSESAGAVERATQAGIRVLMITGDHPRTALAIARDLGIATHAEEVFSGAEFVRLPPTERCSAVARHRVFARIEPLQKLLIVEALQQNGEVVAVTGDGVNDAPALKAANIGVAMGLGGTDVARDAADLILADDHFASIVAGIEEGRVAYANLRKVIALLIATGGAEIVLFMLAIAAGLPPPLSAVQLLWLNLITNGIQDVALAFERSEPGILRLPPRPAHEGLFNRKMVTQVAISGAWIGTAAFLVYQYTLSAGWPLAVTQGALLWFMVFSENAHVFNCRSETLSVLRLPLAGNPLLLGAVLVTQGIQLLAAYTPWLGSIIGVMPMRFEHWLFLALVAALVIPVMEVYKKLLRTRR